MATPPKMPNQALLQLYLTANTYGRGNAFVQVALQTIFSLYWTEINVIIIKSNQTSKKTCYHDAECVMFRNSCFPRKMK